MVWGPTHAQLEVETTSYLPTIAYSRDVMSRSSDRVGRVLRLHGNPLLWEGGCPGRATHCEEPGRGVLSLGR